MDFNQEARIAHKRTFTDFLDRDSGKGDYMTKITQMRDNGRHRLAVDLSDLRHFDSDLTRRLMRQPGEYLPAFEDALDDVVRSFDGKYLKEGQEVHIGFRGQFGFHKLTPRELLSPFLGTLVCVEGIVTKCSLVRPKVVKSVHYCPVTGVFTSREYRDVTSSSGLPTGATYPTRDESGNLLVTEYGLCKYRDHQTVCIQEMPENSPPGQLPRSIDIIVEDDLVDACKPGDRVTISGVYKAIPTKGAGTMSGTFRTVLIANNVSHLNKEIDAPRFTTDDLKNIKMVANRRDAWDLLGESLAPSIYGHKWIKKAVLLLLLGGLEKNLKNGAHIRGDINMMMVGDPSVAKSQVLRAIMHIAPLAISTTGRGSSGVGLTAAVTQDQETGERRLEAGAMVLADRGVVCIDEFDKMSDLDRVAIHEVMEQQTVTIAKAGIHASLNARCSVVAAANPIYGNYDHSLTPTKNIGLPDSLLSRFDLLFIVLDYMDADIDRHISEHVLRVHRYRKPGEEDGMPASDAPGRRFDDDDDDLEADSSIFVKYDRLLHGEKRRRRGKRDPLTSKFLKKFIHYAKSRTPKLTEEASDKIAEAYANMRINGISPERKQETGGALPITARTLETMIRLSTAHAKLKLRKEITVGDVEAALELIEFAIYHRELKDMEQREEEAARRREQGDGGDGDDNDDHPDGDDRGPGGSNRQTPKRRRQSTEGATTGQTGAAQTASPAAETEPPVSGGSRRQLARAARAAQSGDEAATAGTETPGGGGHMEVEGLEEEEGGGEGDRLVANRRRSQQRREESQEEPSARVAEQAAAEASLAAIRDAEPAQIDVSAERTEAFQAAFSAHVMAVRAESIPVEEIMTVVNRSNLQPYTRPEVDSILLQMEADNRLMYAGGVVHMI